MKLKALALAAALFGWGMGKAQAASTITSVYITSLSSGHLNVNWNLPAATTSHVFLSTRSDYSVLIASGNSATLADPSTSTIFSGGASSANFRDTPLLRFLPNTTYYFAVATAPAAQLLLTEFASFSTEQATVTFAARAVQVSTPATADGGNFLYFTNENPLSKTTYTFTASTSAAFSAGGGSTFQVAVTTLAKNATDQVTITGLLPNTTYFLRTWAFNHKTTATQVDFSTFVTRANQPTSASLTTIQITSATVSWSANSNPLSHTTYTVIASEKALFPHENADVFPDKISISTVALSTGPIGSLEPNTTYSFFVAAENSNFLKSTFTFIATTATLANSPVSYNGTANNTLGISTTPARNAGNLTANWFNNSNPTMTTYTVVASTMSNFSLSEGAPWQVTLATAPAVGVNMATGTVSGLRPMTTYWLQVRAVNRNNVKTHFVSLGSTVTVPAPVTALAVSSTGVNTLLFTWTDNSGGDILGNPAVSQKYVIDLSTDFFVTNVNEATVTQTSVTFAGLAQGTNHQIRVLVKTPLGLGVDESSGTTSAATTLSNQAAPAANVSSATYSNVSISSITVAWLNNGLAAGTLYRVQVATDSTFSTINHSSDTKNLFAFFSDGASLGTLMGVEGVQGTGITTPNTQHYFRVQSSGTAGASSFVSLGSTITLARAPTAITPTYNFTGTFITTAPGANITIAWGLNGGPANPNKTKALVERSTSTADFTTVTSSEAYFFVNSGSLVNHLPVDLIGCTTYNIRVRNQSEGGVKTAYGTGTIFVTSNTIPNAPPNFTATSLSGSSVTLTWSQAGPEGVVSYQIYTDTGNSTTVFSTGTAAGTLATRLAVLSSATFSFTTGSMPSSATVRFFITSKHRCGDEEKSGSLALAVTTNSLSSIRAAVTALPGDIRRDSNNLTLGANLISGSASSVSKVVFQFKRASAIGAVPCTRSGVPLEGDTTQYYDIGTSTVSPYNVVWNVSAAGCTTDAFGTASNLEAGAYNLRAVAYDGSSSSDTAPVAITVDVVAAGTAGATLENKNGVTGEVTKVLTIEANTPATVVTAGAITNASGISETRVVTISLPANAFAVPTEVTVVPNPPTTSLPTLPSSSSFAGVVTRISLPANVTLPAGVTVAFTMAIPDSDGNAIIDGTNLRGDTAQIISNDETAGAAWKEDVSTTYDSTNKIMTGITSHFTFFAVAGVVRTNLDLVRVYPVPFKPNGADAAEGRPFVANDLRTGIIFDNLPSKVGIKIYTVSGSLVAKFSTEAGTGAFQWDARNDAGRNVASGGYFAVVSSPGLKSVVKRLAIIR